MVETIAFLLGFFLGVLICFFILKFHFSHELSTKQHEYESSLQRIDELQSSFSEQKILLKSFFEEQLSNREKRIDEIQKMAEQAELRYRETLKYQEGQAKEVRSSIEENYHDSEQKLNLQIEELKQKLKVLDEQYKKDFEKEKENFKDEIKRLKEEYRADCEKNEKNFMEQIINQNKQYSSALEQVESRNKTQQEFLNQYVKENDQKAEKARNEQIELLQSQIKNISEQLLKAREESLKKSNDEQIRLALSPLKESLERYMHLMVTWSAERVKADASFSEQFKHMCEITKKIGTDATNLAKALKAETKIQGDWGEMILKSILENANLVEGKHFTLQDYLYNSDGSFAFSDEGKKMRTDVIFHFPDGRDLVIDSKVSLTDYANYVNADTEESKILSLAKHVESIKRHVRELAKKGYQKYPQNGRAMADFVVMFIPNETSFTVAMNEEPSLFMDAVNKGVYIVSPVNLLTFLYVLQNEWKSEEQKKNQELILKLSRELLERLYSFYDVFDKVGFSLENALKDYQDSIGYLKKGHGHNSIVTTAENLKKIGNISMSKNKKLSNRYSQDDVECLETTEQLSFSQDDSVIDGHSIRKEGKE